MDDVFSIQDPHFWALSRYVQGKAHAFQSCSQPFKTYKIMVWKDKTWSSYDKMHAETSTMTNNFCCLSIYKMAYFVDSRNLKYNLG